MRKIVFVKPLEGVRIRDPKTRDVLPENGKRVELNTYWSRRIKENSVIIIESGSTKKGEI